MDIRVLRYFLAAAREENITRAAESLHIAQPSLSKQLMELEQEIGKKLFIRGKRKLVLTEEGILLRKRAEEIVDLMEKTKQELTSDFRDVTGDVYIGGNAVEEVLQAAAALQRNHQVQFHFYSGDATAILERLDHGNLDFAVMLRPVDVVKYDFLPLSEESEWGLLMNVDDPLSKEAAITGEQLKGLPLILHQRIGLQQDIAHWAQTDLESLHIAATYNVVHGSPFPYVHQRLGYFLTTRDLLAPQLDDSVCFRPLTPRLPVHYALVWKKHAVFSKAAETFLHQLR